jgi:rhamnosyltransferase
MAAYNGMAFLDQQLDSILNQRGVDVHVLISVDRSDDGTEEHVSHLAKTCDRVTHLPHGERFGAAAPNFYRLIREADFDGFTHVALSDQDDVWLPHKLMRATQLLGGMRCAAYSSNVFVWNGSDSKKLLHKSQRQRRWDHLFSSAGPGCTYVFPASVMKQFAEWLVANDPDTTAVDYHDWLAYAWARENGFGWHIDDEPTMLYRQHAENQLGANRGFRAARARLSQIRNGWFHGQVALIARLVDASDAPPVSVLRQRTWRSKLQLLFAGRNLRRSGRDAASLTLLLLIPQRRESA